MTRDRDDGAASGAVAAHGMQFVTLAVMPVAGRGGEGVLVVSTQAVDLPAPRRQV
jgi:hypothetical protein